MQNSGLFDVDGHDGQTGADQERKVGEVGIGADFGQRDGAVEGFDRREIACQPSGVNAGRVGIGLACDAQNAKDCLVALALVKEYIVAQSHGGQVLTCFGIADATQDKNAATDYFRPRGAEWGKFNEPILCLFVFFCVFLLHFY